MGAGARLRRLSGVHAQAAHRRVVSRLHAADAVRPGSVLSAVRHPQRPHRRGGARRRRQRAVRVPAPARHGRSALRGSRRRRRNSTAPAASTRRSAVTRTCSPISSAACSRTAPTPRSSIASPTRRRPSPTSSAIRSKRPSASAKRHAADARLCRPARSSAQRAATALGLPLSEPERPRRAARPRGG